MGSPAEVPTADELAEMAAVVTTEAHAIEMPALSVMFDVAAVLELLEGDEGKLIKLLGDVKDVMG